MGSHEDPPGEIVTEIDGPCSFPATVGSEIPAPADRLGVNRVLKVE
jgi:hypothetical protein